MGAIGVPVLLGMYTPVSVFKQVRTCHIMFEHVRTCMFKHAMTCSKVGRQAEQSQNFNTKSPTSQKVLGHFPPASRRWKRSSRRTRCTHKTIMVLKHQTLDFLAAPIIFNFLEVLTDSNLQNSCSPYNTASPAMRVHNMDPGLTWRQLASLIHYYYRSLRHQRLCLPNCSSYIHAVAKLI